MKKLLNKEFLKWNFEFSNKSIQAEKLFSCFFEGSMTVWAVSAENKKFKIILMKALLNFLNKDLDKKIIFDCRSVLEIDSSGLAMLLSCLRQASQLGYEPRLVHVPQKALDLIEAQGLRMLIKPYVFSMTD